MDFVSLENKGKKLLARFPKTRRFFKGIYHRVSYVLSKDKIKCEGNIVRISPKDEYEYFFGYYDKSPWDITDRYMISLRVKNAHKVPDSTEEAQIVVFDTQSKNKMEIIGTTHCWNTQQGCMAQWLSPDFSKRIIYNDFRDGKYISVVYNFETKKEERTYDMPIYDVAKNGKFALTLDFSRLHRLRLGYGYANIEETTKKELCPDKPCIWKIDLETGDINPIIKYIDLAKFEPREEMKDAEHKVNHIMISPNGKRFMFLHRWFKHNEKFTRLVTMNIDGTDMYNLSDDNFVSHCCWKNDKEILSFLRKKGTGDHYYLMKDKTKDYTMQWPELNTDGHCTYSPDGEYVITDTYPNRKRIASVYLCVENKKSTRLARVFAPFKYDNDVRCDLHPRWDHKNEKVCIDSVHEGKKGLYTIDSDITKIEKYKEIKASIIIPCYNSAKTISRTLKSLQNQLHKNNEIIIIDDGSKDNLEKVIKNPLFNNLNIKYINKNNTGVSDTRNVGLSKATGKYIFFLDSDDIYSPTFIYKSIKTCEEANVDCVIFNQSRNIEKVENGQLDFLSKDPVIKAKSESLHYFMYNKEKIVFASMVYKKNIIDNLKIKFDINTKYGEDLEFVWKYLINCKKIACSNEYMYGYFNNPNSAVNTVKWEKTDLPKAVERAGEYIKEMDNQFYQDYCNYMIPRTYWTTAKTFAVGNRKDYFDKFIKEYQVKEQIKKLAKSSKNKLLKISSILFLINKYLFYYGVKIAYKIKK